MKIERALISVSDKTAVVELARCLNEHSITIVSTGGTAKTLRDAGIAVMDVESVTGFPEVLDGRVKTLHPAIHGGILARRNLETHQQTLSKMHISGIDLVVVNLYPFRETVSRPDVDLETAIENIDIGGPAMIRSAAKNHQDVVVVVDPADYSLIIDAINTNSEIPAGKRLQLATKAFAHTAKYDLAISAYLAKVSGELPAELGDTRDGLPEEIVLFLSRRESLRYGENPHQAASLFCDLLRPEQGRPVQHHGKELSYNNYVDMEAAVELVEDFDTTACAIIKHTNPCGVGLGATPLEAYSNALSTDPVSAFGGIVAFNTTVDLNTATELSKLFLEVIITPAFTPDALEFLKNKKNLRLITYSQKKKGEKQLRKVVKSIGGEYLVQSMDTLTFDRASCAVKTHREPTESEWRDLGLAWTICKHVKSNAIVYAGQNRLVGVGAGQMSRIDSVRFGAQKARLPLSGTVLASDAFFPFRDSVDEAAKHGITAIIQPGGSIKDSEVIDAANEHGLAMVFTGVRHFRH